MDKFLEVFYQDVDFVELTADEQTQKELDELLIDDNDVQYETPEGFALLWTCKKF